MCTFNGVEIGDYTYLAKVSAEVSPCMSNELGHRILVATLRQVFAVRHHTLSSSSSDL